MGKKYCFLRNIAYTTECLNTTPLSYYAAVEQPEISSRQRQRIFFLPTCSDLLWVLSTIQCVQRAYVPG
jgi:hypothetical protein